MGHVKNISHAVLGQGDSRELWEEIVSHIPDEVFLKKDVRILNVACGHAEETKAIIRRMLALGRTKKDIKNAIVLNDKYRCFTAHWYSQGFEVVTGDFLEWETDMKFDVVIGNPPYQEADKDNAGTKKFWNRFLKKAITLAKDDGCVLFLNPTDWLKIGYKEFAYLQNHLIKGRVLSAAERAKYFKGVGSTFSYIFCTVQKEDTLATLISGDDEVSVDLSKFLVLPKDGSPIAVSIFNKLRRQPKMPFIGGTLRGVASSTRGRFRIMHGADAKYHKRVSVKSELYSKWKVMVPEMQVYEKLWYDKDCDTAQSVFSVICTSKKEAKSLATVLSKKLYRFIADRCKFSARNNLTTCQFFPAVDLTRTWTDEELYKHFKLTKKEIEYIEETVK